MAITQFLTNPTNAAELIALGFALFSLRGKHSGYWRYFILYLLFLILLEGTGFYYRAILKEPNYPFYNFLMVVQSFYFSFLFYKFGSGREKRIWFFGCCLLFLVFFILEGAKNSFSEYNRYSRQFLSLLIVFFCCSFYFSILKSDSVKSPLSYPPFWIVTGLFFFYFGSAAMFALYDRVSQIKLSGNLSFYTLVMGCLSCILYGSWIIGFLCKRKQIQ
jgi:hypothetical protein